MVWVRERWGAERISERRACQVLGQARSTQRREWALPSLPQRCRKHGGARGLI